MYICECVHINMHVCVCVCAQRHISLISPGLTWPSPGEKTQYFLSRKNNTLLDESPLVKRRAFYFFGNYYL